MSEATIKDALDKLRGAVTIVYPMGLPPHDPIRMEFEGTEDLTGTQVIILFAGLLCHLILHRHLKRYSMRPLPSCGGLERS